MIQLNCADFSAIIDENHGANCVSLRNERLGIAILKEHDENPYLMGMPVLFPVNRIADGKFVFEGRTYTFPINEPRTNCHIHGTLHQLPFTVLEKKDDKVVLEFVASEDAPYMLFPHAFRFQITYILRENGLEQITRIKNESNENMPVMLGYHTTFQLPFSKHSKTENCRIRADVSDHYERRLDVDYLPTGEVLPKDRIDEALVEGNFLRENISRLQRSAGAGLLSIEDQSVGFCVEYTNDTKFQFRLLYSHGEDFICLEPNTCIPNCLNMNVEDDGFAFIQPGQTEEYASSIVLKRI